MNDPIQPVLFDLGTPKPVAVIEEVFEPPKPPETDLTTPMEFQPPVCGATFSEDRVFRYRLFRRYREKGPTLTFCCLNCSVAGEVLNDPSVTRMEGYAKRDKYAQLIVVNMCAYVATDPKDMKKASDPGGPDHPKNLEAIIAACAEADKVCLGWGNHGQWRDYGRRTFDALVKAGLRNKLHCLRVTKLGEPSHPLYLKADLPLVPFAYGMTQAQEKCRHEKQSYDSGSNTFYCNDCGVYTGHGDPTGHPGPSGSIGETFEEEF